MFVTSPVFPVSLLDCANLYLLIRPPSYFFSFRINFLKKFPVIVFMASNAKDATASKGKLLLIFFYPN